LAALRADIKPGELVLDYCGGSGGKSLAIAHLLQGKGQIFVHEPREVALGKARRRFARAGVNNVQFHSNEESLGRVGSGKMDWVIVDAPCTGTGTLRRNPDIKLKFSESWIKSNVILQQQIVAKAMRFLSKNGRLLYITCSLLRQENDEQIKLFCQLHNLEV
jgi:16S rRNA (cytosine967-C5)-methyltransferase